MRIKLHTELGRSEMIDFRDIERSYHKEYAGRDEDLGRHIYSYREEAILPDGRGCYLIYWISKDDLDDVGGELSDINWLEHLDYAIIRGGAA